LTTAESVVVRRLAEPVWLKAFVSLVKVVKGTDSVVVLLAVDAVTTSCV
jgi:hypothetical protein